MSQANKIIPYLEMCHRERVNLQRGMNFRLGGNYSVILMSVRPNAPYSDYLEEDGTVLIYEGHDTPRNSETPNPKTVDQPAAYPSGRPTQNGHFFQAALEYKNKHQPPETVRVYEKIRQGIWSYNGVFHLVDSWTEFDGVRSVFKFKLIAVEEQLDSSPMVRDHPTPRRVIPTSVKFEVWKRDRARCVICEATDDLHFDHIIPYSKGGSSSTAENIQLLCARHNISKGARIE